MRPGAHALRFRRLESSVSRNPPAPARRPSVPGGTSMIAKLRCALLLLALAALPVSAGPPERSEEDGAIPATLPAAFAAIPAHDCAFGGLADPDRAVLRREKARTTRLLAPAHPAALATAAELAGIPGLLARIPHASFTHDDVFAPLDAPSG